MAHQSGSTAPAVPDALALLRADHDKVRGLFRQFEDLSSDEDDEQRKADLVDEICYELTIHSMIEDEIFYPVVRAAIDDDDLIDEADVEHAGARDLISQLEVMYPGDDHFDATITVLSEEIEHHIEKEESDIFMAARGAGIDLRALGERMAARKDELELDLTAPASPRDGMDPQREMRRPPRAPG